MVLHVFQNLSIVRQTAVVIFVATLVVMGLQTTLAARGSHAALAAEASDRIEKQVGLTVDLLEFYDRTLRNNAERLGGIFLSRFSTQFSMDSTSTIRVGEYNSPILRNGDTVLNLGEDSVDQFANLTG